MLSGPNHLAIRFVPTPSSQNSACVPGSLFSAKNSTVTVSLPVGGSLPSSSVVAVGVRCKKPERGPQGVRTMLPVPVFVAGYTRFEGKASPAATISELHANGVDLSRATMPRSGSALKACRPFLRLTRARDSGQPRMTTRLSCDRNVTKHPL